jgi:hypothetical protein
LPPAACESIERAAVSWRWKLRGRVHRLSMTHGDFHPWNILFREGNDFSLLDRSRGEWGEPADDVSALSVNYLFFGLRKGALSGEPEVVAEPFLGLFHDFLNVYLDRSGDREILQVLPPLFMFRALVIAHPRWYPDLAEGTRVALINFAQALSRDLPFDPATLPTLFRSVR